MDHTKGNQNEQAASREQTNQATSNQSKTRSNTRHKSKNNEPTRETSQHARLPQDTPSDLEGGLACLRSFCRPSPRQQTTPTPRNKQSRQRQDENRCGLINIPGPNDHGLLCRLSGHHHFSGVPPNHPIGPDQPPGVCRCRIPSCQRPISCCPGRSWEGANFGSAGLKPPPPPPPKKKTPGEGHPEHPKKTI